MPDIDIPIEEAKKMPSVLDLAVRYRDAVLCNDQTAIGFFYDKAPTLRTIPVPDPKHIIYHPKVMNELQKLKPTELALLRQELKDRGRAWLSPEAKDLLDRIAPRREF